MFSGFNETQQMNITNKKNFSIKVAKSDIQLTDDFEQQHAIELNRGMELSASAPGYMNKNEKARLLIHGDTPWIRSTALIYSSGGRIVYKKAGNDEYNVYIIWNTIENGSRPAGTNPCYVQCPNCLQTGDYWKTGFNTTQGELNILTCLICQKPIYVIGLGDGCLQLKDKYDK